MGLQAQRLLGQGIAASTVSGVDLSELEIFARVVEAQSFSAAARRLGLCKSVVSKRISHLERTLGVQLLRRSTRAVTPTESGREFYGRCAEILAAAEEAELAITQAQTEPRGTLRVACPVSFGTLHLARALPRLLERCPGLTVDVTLTNRVVNLIEEGYDVAVSIMHELVPGLVARKIACYRQSTCASPAYLQRHGTPVHPKDLTCHNCLVFTGQGSRRAWRFAAAGSTLNVDVRGNLCFNNLDAIRTAAIAGAGVAVLPHYLIAGDLVRRELVALLEDHAPPTAAIHAVFPPSRHLSPKVRSFVDFLIGECGRHREWQETLQHGERQLVEQD